MARRSRRSSGGRATRPAPKPGRDDGAGNGEVDARVSARAARLRYVSDDGPGITRRRSGSGFRYLAPDGSRITEKQEVARLNGLRIPPAWTDVWICPHPNGHLQATGRDARGRKQYRYHPKWREVRDATKYHRLIAFGRALPKIRRRVDRDLRRRALSREKVVATVVRLLDTTYIRVGNKEYADENGSFGLTTMRDRHVQVRGAQISFRFRGKGGKQHDVDVADARVARIVKRCQELPGHHLFQYLDADGEVHELQSDDVNAYLQEVTGEDFTAKDFRTWAGTVLAAWSLDELGEYASDAQAKRQVVGAVESVARQLGNTPAICRKCYIHPEVLGAYLDGTLQKNLASSAERTLSKGLAGLSSEEAAVLALLRPRLDDR
jgi:DNA topoisomerase I